MSVCSVQRTYLLRNKEAKKKKSRKLGCAFDGGHVSYREVLDGGGKWAVNRNALIVCACSVV